MQQIKLYSGLVLHISQTLNLGLAGVTVIEAYSLAPNDTVATVPGLLPDNMFIITQAPSIQVSSDVQQQPRIPNVQPESFNELLRHDTNLSSIMETYMPNFD